MTSQTNHDAALRLISLHSMGSITLTEQEINDLNILAGAWASNEPCPQGAARRAIAAINRHSDARPTIDQVMAAPGLTAAQRVVRLADAHRMIPDKADLLAAGWELTDSSFRGRSYRGPDCSRLYIHADGRNINAMPAE